VTVPPRTVMRLTSVPRDSSGRLLPVDTTGVVSSTAGSYGIWDAACKVLSDHTVDAIVSNTTGSAVHLSADHPVGYFEFLDESQTRDIDELFVDEICSIRSAAKPSGPPPAPTPADHDFIRENVVIAAPDAYKEQYIDLLLKYHDVISKGKFDLGWTDAIQHKIEMTDDDPIHIKQFRIPLEHRQQIYDWVDELLQKGAIEVSRSAYNSPIFLVPKPHGHGMRAVLDYRAVNLKSKPDRYTIREIRDCIDEIGLAKSQVFSTIDLTSGFWQQSLEESSRAVTSFTVPGKWAYKVPLPASPAS